MVNKNQRLDLNFAVPFEAKSMLTETEVMAQTGFLIFFDEELAGVLSIVDPLKPGVQDFLIYSSNPSLISGIHQTLYHTFPLNPIHTHFTARATSTLMSLSYHHTFSLYPPYLSSTSVIILPYPTSFPTTGSINP